MNRVRQIAIGIAEYFWSSSHDERTVGKPGGLYPKGSAGHGNHWERDYRNNGGKAHPWAEPFDDGFPGEAYRCRCKAIAKIETIKLNHDLVLVGDPVISFSRFA